MSGSKLSALLKITVVSAACWSVPLVRSSQPAALWRAPAEATRARNPFPANASSIEGGKGIYIKRCAACHGKAGQGDGPTAQRRKITPGDFTSAQLRQQRDGELFWKITEGKTPMPGFGKEFSETDRWNLVNYIRSLAAP
jgi:mono/diheme cytochrome c family protein